MPIQVKLAILIGSMVLLVGLAWKVRAGGYNACTAKYEQVMAAQKEAARKDIMEIEKAANDKIKKLYQVETNNNPVGSRTTYAIDSL